MAMTKAEKAMRGEGSGPKLEGHPTLKMFPAFYTRGGVKFYFAVWAENEMDAPLALLHLKDNAQLDLDSIEGVDA